jgi:hypothetical protein
MVVLKDYYIQYFLRDMGLMSSHAWMAFGMRKGEVASQ